MRLETILKAATSSMIRGHHKPHCYSAHVPGAGYSNNGDNPATRADYLRQLERSATSEAENATHSPHYSEPGYDAPKRGIIFANWNVFPPELGNILTRAGYSCEWSDEWSTCEDCGGAVRTSADSYSWEPSYRIIDECSVVCHECMDWEAYCRSVEDDPTKAVGSDVDPEEYGYERLSDPEEYENGLHAGQTDEPAKILAALKAQGKTGVLFRISGVGQFDVTFETWIRRADKED